MDPSEINSGFEDIFVRDAVINEAKLIINFFKKQKNHLELGAKVPKGTIFEGYWLHFFWRSFYLFLTGVHFRETLLNID